MQMYRCTHPVPGRTHVCTVDRPHNLESQVESTFVSLLELWQDFAFYPPSSLSLLPDVTRRGSQFSHILQS
jgi:hypothetical protein